MAAQPFSFFVHLCQPAAGIIHQALFIITAMRQAPVVSKFMQQYFNKPFLVLFITGASQPAYRYHTGITRLLTQSKNSPVRFTGH